MLTVEQALAAIFIAAAVTFFTRIAPFLFFSKGNPPYIVVYLQKYMPPMTMVILVVYSLKDVAWTVFPFGTPAVIGVLSAFFLHIVKNNSLISIFGATAIYMFLSRTF